jgi:serine/threonine protein kinase
MAGVDSLLTVGRYGLDEWLASDDLGVMFRGYDPVLERAVAIKIVRRELTKSPTAAGWLDRFKRKARAGGRLFHPNITAILDYGEEDEMPFVIMELVEGYSLDRLLKTSGTLAPKRALRIISQVLSALEFSHKSAIFHLNLKPSIIFVGEDDRIKVADFGIAQTDVSEFVGLGEVLGTPGYMAPEQLAGTPVDHRSDVFAAAVVLFEILTAGKPFLDEDGTDVAVQMHAGKTADLCALNPEVSDALRDVISTGLAFDPDRRFATAGAFSRALAETGSVTERARIVAASPSSPAALATTPAPPAAHVIGWDVAALRIAESDLATHIGPVASIAVKRAAKQATDLIDLYEILSSYIERSDERDEFMAKGRRAIRVISRQGPTWQPERSASEAPPRPNSPADLPERAVLDAIEARLAQHIGPIARIVLKQELQHFESLPAFGRALADHIADDAERTAFLNWVGAG